MTLVTASHLRYSSGCITEQLIGESDIRTFAQICQSVTDSDSEDVIKLIYLRRHYEIMDDRGDAYQVLSNLFHHRETPIDSREPVQQGVGYPEMVAEKVANGCQAIALRIPGFDYAATLVQLTDPDRVRALYSLCRSGYEKLQVFRLLQNGPEDAGIRKFMNETYHIENEFICQLDPARFDLIPEYVIRECDALIFPPPSANDDAMEEIA